MQNPNYNFPLDHFKKLLWIEGRQYFGELNRSFQVDDENSKFLDIICRYFANHKSFEEIYGGELRKGLLVYGPCGTGKSSIFDIVQNISRRYNLHQLWFSNISMHDLVMEFNQVGEYVDEKYKKGKVHFDDLGSEKIANSWGVKEKLMNRILELRYNEYKKKGTKTHITTNLNIEELSKFYGNSKDPTRNRFGDRIHEMFNFISLEGDSRRV